MPLPTIIYWGIGITIFLSGLVLYLTATDFRMEDIFQFLPKIVVSVQKKIDKRRIGALVLIILGLAASFTFSDRLIAEASNPQSTGGGPSLYHCSDLLNLACWFSGANSGAVSNTNSTLCTSGNTLCNQVHSMNDAFSSSPFSTTSAVFVSTGVGASIHRVPGQNVSVMAYSTLFNNNAGGSGAVAIYESTTGVPSAGTSVGSDCQITAQVIFSAAASTSEMFAIITLDFPGICLAAGTSATIFYYIGARANTPGGSTETLNNNGAGMELIVKIEY